MSQQTPGVGDNLTGAGAAPNRAKAMMTGTEEFGPTSTGSPTAASDVRIAYAKMGMPVGSIPKKGMDGKAVDKSAAPLLDKLGARLAFERSGVRLYDALISKHDAYGSFDGGPSRDDLADIRREEHTHMQLCERAIMELGGDPTAVTPSADIEMTVGSGVGSVLSDPRTTLLQSLEAVVVAELADNACWLALAEVAELAGKDKLGELFRGALETEETHLEKVNAWIAAGQGRRPTKH